MSAKRGSSVVYIQSHSSTAFLTHSLNEYLDLVKPFVSTDLIDPQNWLQIAAIAQFLPTRLTEFFGFECRLGNPAAQADFLLCVGADEIGQKILADQTEANELTQLLSGKPVWEQIHNFAATWADPASLLHQNVNNIWLEFDVDSKGKLPTSLPLPSCFFGSQNIHSATDYVWVTQTAIASLQGQALPPALERQLFCCFDTLPKDAYVFQVGLMLARRSQGVRICVRNISSAQILDYLNQLGWTGNLDALKTLLTDLSNYASRIDLDLDVEATGVAAKIGLECYFTQQPKYEPQWQAFLDYLVETGQCLPQKRTAVLSYPGFVREKACQQWPSHLSKLSRFLGNGHESILMRGLHHVKVVYQEESVQEAKVYCWVTQRLVSKQLFNQPNSVSKATLQNHN